MPPEYLCQFGGNKFYRLVVADNGRLGTILFFKVNSGLPFFTMANGKLVREFFIRVKNLFYFSCGY